MLHNQQVKDIHLVDYPEKFRQKISISLLQMMNLVNHTCELPRDDIASLHRIFFMGNLSRWSSMELRLNAQNQGLTFDAQKSIE